ncbi:MAG TPA: lectin [Xanthobacteraceae bacterium]|nr:lectin [Xanthobacteraceae bacterium]
MHKTMRYSLLASATVLLFGVSGGAQAQQVPQAPDMTFFVTSVGSGKGGDLGGLAGADAHCHTLAATAGAGNKAWRAYLSGSDTPAAGKAVNARDRIGKGPWQNAKGVVIATGIDDLHSANNKLTSENSLTERGTRVSGFGYTPNWHDVLTGSQPDGTAYPGNINMTCNNWVSGEFGKAGVGHVDRRGGADNEYQRSWNAAHQSRGCSQADLIATGGNGLYYCFAQ